MRKHVRGGEKKVILTEKRHIFSYLRTSNGNIVICIEHGRQQRSSKFWMGAADGGEGKASKTLKSAEYANRVARCVPNL